MTRTIRADSDILIQAVGDINLVASGAVGVTSGDPISFPGDVTIQGSLTVQGANTYVSSTDTDITDNVVVLNSGESGAGISLTYSGLEIERGSLSNVAIRFNETSDKFEVTEDGSTYYEVVNTGTTGVFITELSDDTTPVLGGNLDVGGFNIGSSSNGNVEIAPNGTGDLVLTSANFVPSGSNDIGESGTRWNAVYATTIDGTTLTGTLSTAAQPNVTSLGILTTLTVDDITINANTISSAGASALTITPTAGQALYLDDSNVSVDGGVVDITGDLDIDNININGNTILTTDTNGDLVLDTDGTGSTQGIIDASNIVTAMRLPSGATGDRPTAADGLFRYNTTTGNIEYSDGGSWTALIGISTNTISQGDSDVTVSDAGAGTITVTVDGGTISDYTTSGFQLGGSGARVTTILDEDSMSTDSDTALATQQSIKAYVDALASIGVGDSAVSVTDSGTGVITLNTDSTDTLQVTAGAVVLPQSSNTIRTNTSDASDNSRINICGGGAATVSRGAIVEVYGNENAATGQLRLVAGNVTGGEIQLYTGNGVERVVIDENGDVTINNSIYRTNDSSIQDIGTELDRWSTVYAETFNGTATMAQYADLAENYVADANYEPGTVVIFGGDQEVTISSVDEDTAVAGIVSEFPATLMNSAQEGEHVAAVALRGRVPCKVVGPVLKGDLMVATSNGRAAAAINPSVGSVLGKALEACGDGEHVIDVVVV